MLAQASAASQRNFIGALPTILYVGNSGCVHSSLYELTWYTTFCGLCFMIEGFTGELPTRLHESRLLADNGNPQQSGKLMSHVSVVEGFAAPDPEQNLKQYRLARGQYTRRSPRLFPFASALQELMGHQPPLARPLILACQGFHEPEIAARMDLSVYNVAERIRKGLALATGSVRKYSDHRSDR